MIPLLQAGSVGQVLPSVVPKESGFMGDNGYPSWVLDERKILGPHQVLTLRQLVRKRVDEVGLRRRVPWLEWFLIELALETGLRVAEMAALRCSDLVLMHAPHAVIVRRGKGGKPRYVRVSRSFGRCCGDYLNIKEAWGESVRPESPVFLSSVTARPMTTRGLQKMFARLCNRVGILGHSIHHCRHTYATYLYKASGKDLRLVQRQLGHASVRTTEVYAHVLDEDVCRAVNGLFASIPRE